MPRGKRKGFVSHAQRKAVMAIITRREVSGIARAYKVKMQRRGTIVNAIRQAGSVGKKIKIQYSAQKHGGKIKTYITEPYSMRIKGDKQFFYGFKGTDKGIRAFNVDRILSATPLQKTFEPRWDVEFKTKRKKRV